MIIIVKLMKIKGNEFRGSSVGLWMSQSKT